MRCRAWSTLTKTLPLISVYKHRTPNCSSPLFVRGSQSEVIVLEKKRREDGITGKLLLSDRITRRAENKAYSELRLIQSSINSVEL